MTKNQFIKQANLFGKYKKPFVFIIDFEMKKFIFSPLKNANKNGIFFDFSAKKNNKKENFLLDFEPIDFNVYKKAFDIVKKHLENGDTYLLNLTFPIKINTKISLEEIFVKSVAKYKLMLKDNFVMFSPETFVKINKNKICTYPMKGTIDASIPQAKEKILNNPKELREHFTVVDLLRNDLAIIATDVQVNKFRFITKIKSQNKHLLQVSSEICGKMQDNWNEFIGNIILKILPAGSISGAPKKRTIEIIKNTEIQSRGYYTGISGIFDGKSLETAVNIRFIEKKINNYYYRSGGGITVYSNPEQEYQELLNKIYVPTA